MPVQFIDTLHGILQGAKEVEDWSKPHVSYHKHDFSHRNVPVAVTHTKLYCRGSLRFDKSQRCGHRRPFPFFLYQSIVSSSRQSHEPNL